MSLFGSANNFAGDFSAGNSFAGNFNAGNLFTTGRVEAPSVVSNFNAAVGGATGADSPIVKQTAQSANRNTERTTQTSGRKRTKTTGQSREQQVRDTQSVSDAVLAAIDQGIAGNFNDPTLRATDEGRVANIQAIMDAIANFDQAEILAGAEGDVSALSRQLMEDVLPQVTGAVEASGSSNNALGALLAQDAASRTAEAQARVREEARANAANEFLGMIQAATGATGRGSATADNLNALINAAKGTVDRGTILTNRTFEENQDIISEQRERMREGMQSVGSEQTIGSGSGAGGSVSGGDSDMMAKLALLQSSLSPFQTLQDLTNRDPNRGSAAKASSRSVRALASKLGIF